MANIDTSNRGSSCPCHPEKRWILFFNISYDTWNKAISMMETCLSLQWHGCSLTVGFRGAKMTTMEGWVFHFWLMTLESSCVGSILFVNIVTYFFRSFGSKSHKKSYFFGTPLARQKWALIRICSQTWKKELTSPKTPAALLISSNPVDV